MLNSPPWHTVNMKLLLFTFVVCFAAALAAPADKKKRDILPGDPRYGTEHHHHQEHENEIQISKAAGGYVGSYSVPADTVPADNSFQVPQSSYGPPSHTPGQPLGPDFFAAGDADKNSILVPSTSYGIPDSTQLLNSNFFSVPHASAASALDDKKPTAIKTTVEEQPKFDTLQKTVIPELHHDVHHVQQPAVVHKHVEAIPQTVSLPQVKVTSHLSTGAQGVHQSVPSTFSSFPNYYSYSSYSNIPVKTVDRHVQVQIPQPYQVPVTKHIAVPVPVPHTVEVPKPYYVRVPQPVQVTVDRPYPVEVPRPVPYPVHHYVKTNVPVAHHHVVPTVVDTKAGSLQTFFDNAQTNFQNVFSGLPTFSNPLDNFQNPFENFDFSSFPGVSFIPGPIQSLIPQAPSTVPATTPEQPVPSGPVSDSVTVDNAALKGETFIKTPIVQPITNHIKTTNQAYKPSTACAGCTVTSSSSNKQEYVQPTDANGGYVY